MQSWNQWVLMNNNDTKLSSSGHDQNWMWDKTSRVTLLHEGGLILHSVLFIQQPLCHEGEGWAAVGKVGRPMPAAFPLSFFSLFELVKKHKCH